MSFKVSSGKAQGVHKLKELFPGAWSSDAKIPNPDVALFDSLQGLIGFKDGTGGECAMRVSHLPRQFMERGCPVVVLCFDRQAYVPFAKAAEQALRTEAVNKRILVNSVLEHKDFVSYRDLAPPRIWFDQLVPDDFDLGLQDRDGYRRDVIRFLCKTWICGPNSSARLEPQPGCKVIISGHCLRPEDLTEITQDEEDWSALGLRPTDDPEDTPIVLERDVFQFDRTLSHQIGEGEMQFFHFLRQLAPKNALLVSTDSDVLFLALEFLRSAGKLDLEWRYDGRQAERQYCHITRFVEDVLKGAMVTVSLNRGKRKCLEINTIKERWIKQSDPIGQLIAAQSFAGTDYTQGFLKVTHEMVYMVLLIVGDKIGPLIVNGEPSPEAYMRLLAAAWIHARLPELEYVPPCAMAKKGDDSTTTSAGDIEAGWREHRLKIWNASQRFESRYRFPHPVADGIIYCNRILRWVYHLNMIAQVGSATLSLPDPRDWGYGPLVGTAEMTRNNIFPLLDENR